MSASYSAANSNASASSAASSAAFVSSASSPALSGSLCHAAPGLPEQSLHTVSSSSLGWKTWFFGSSLLSSLVPLTGCSFGVTVTLTSTGSSWPRLTPSPPAFHAHGALYIVSPPLPSYTCTSALSVNVACTEHHAPFADGNFAFA